MKNLVETVSIDDQVKLVDEWREECPVQPRAEKPRYATFSKPNWVVHAVAFLAFVASFLFEQVPSLIVAIVVIAVSLGLEARAFAAFKRRCRGQGWERYETDLAEWRA